MRGSQSSAPGTDTAAAPGTDAPLGAASVPSWGVPGRLFTPGARQRFACSGSAPSAGKQPLKPGKRSGPRQRARPLPGRAPGGGQRSAPGTERTGARAGGSPPGRGFPRDAQGNSGHGPGRARQARLVRTDPLRRPPLTFSSSQAPKSAPYVTVTARSGRPPPLGVRVAAVARSRPRRPSARLRAAPLSRPYLM